MSGINDTLLIGVLLVLIFGAVSFYLYSRLGQTEKRLSLMENLLLALKMNTEASLMGPESIEPISGPMPLSSDEVENVEEEDYAELLKDIGPETILTPANSEASEEAEKPRLVEADVSDIQSVAASIKLNANYESMTLKELQALAKQKGLSGIPRSKKELIDVLKKSGSPPDVPSPLAVSSDELEGVNTSDFRMGLE
jgi:hypothetical protein